MDIFLAERTSEFTYGLLNSVRTQEVTSQENPEYKKVKYVQKIQLSF
jgi:hypothetical protein